LVAVAVSVAEALVVVVVVVVGIGVGAGVGAAAGVAVVFGVVAVTESTSGGTVVTFDDPSLGERRAMPIAPTTSTIVIAATSAIQLRRRAIVFARASVSE